jgi:hypothetical protein
MIHQLLDTEYNQSQSIHFTLTLKVVSILLSVLAMEHVKSVFWFRVAVNVNVEFII